MVEDKLIELAEAADLSAALAESATRPVVLFKHSLTCPISAYAFREVRKHLANAGDLAAYRLIVVQRARPVSNEVASRLGITHESPQVIIVRHEQAVWDASHNEITSQSLTTALQTVS